MANTDPGDASTSDIQAVARVGEIAALFLGGTVELSAADVAERTKLNRTTAYRYCASMVAAGILQRGARRGTFALGRLMLDLGIHALGRQRVLEVAPAHLRELRTAARMTAVLSLWGATGPVVALVEDDLSRALVVTVRPGTRLDDEAAQTHVFLAYEGPDAFDLIASGMDPDRRRRLGDDVAQTRRLGYSVRPQVGGLIAASAPILADGAIRATVAVLGARPAEEVGEGSEVLDALRATAAAIGRELG